MKVKGLLIGALMASGIAALYATSYDGIYVWKSGSATRFDFMDIIFGEAGSMTIGETLLKPAEVDSITFSAPTEEPRQITDTLYIYYNGSEASVTPSSAQGVDIQVDGADVSIGSSIADRELTFVLSGESQSGSFTLASDYKTCLRLAGLSLKGSTAEAVNVKCGKRVALELADGTENILEDCTDDNGQKAAFYTKGHLEISGGGSLTLRGNVKHALSSKEYMLVKKTTGSITVTGAASDGVHAGQYFQMNGGQLTILGTKGDGIQAEAIGEGKEQDGQLIVKDGQLDITLTGRDAAALKSDSLLTVSGGRLTVNTSGDADKGLKSKADISISGGETTITQTGKYIVVDGDPGFVTAVKANGNIGVTGGLITIDNSGEAGKGLSADGNVTVDETSASMTLNIKANGAGSTLDMSRNVSGDEPQPDEEEKEEDKTLPTDVYRVYVALSSTQLSSYWTNIYLCDSRGTRLGQLTRTYTIKPMSTSYSTLTFYYYDFDGPSSSSYYFASDDVTSTGGGGGGNRPGGGGGSRTTKVKSSTFTGPTSSKPSIFYSISTSYSGSTTRTYSLSDVTARYSTGTVTESGTASSGSGGSSTAVTAACIKADGNVSIAGGTLILSSTGVASKGITADKLLSVDGGSITITNSGAGGGSGNNTFTAKGLTSDTQVAINGGQLDIRMTGNGGKGIKSDGKLTIGSKDGTGPTLAVSTTGSKYASTSSAKAIKSMGELNVMGGDITVNTATEGAEGMESKTSVTISGGQTYMKCYDDCINSSGKITFDGGITECWSNGNDAVDSNLNSAGSITIGNGIVMAVSSKGGPEMGFDNDNSSNIRITGTGIGISMGGNQGGGGGSSSVSISGAAQGYAFYTSSISFSTGRYYTLADSSGQNLATFTVPTSVSSSCAMFTATGMKSGSQYSLKYSTTKPTDAATQFHDLYIGSSAKGTTSVISFTAK